MMINQHDQVQNDDNKKNTKQFSNEEDDIFN